VLNWLCDFTWAEKLACCLQARSRNTAVTMATLRPLAAGRAPPNEPRVDPAAQPTSSNASSCLWTIGKGGRRICDLLVGIVRWVRRPAFTRGGDVAWDTVYSAHLAVEF